MYIFKPKNCFEFRYCLKYYYEKYRTSLPDPFLQEMFASNSRLPERYQPLPMILRWSCFETVLFVAFAPTSTYFFLYHAVGFSAICMVANVTPIPMKGEVNKHENYRPIAICSTLSEVMYSILNFHLTRYLVSRNLLCHRQYGFRGDHSTGDLLAFLSEKRCHALHHFVESKVFALDY